MRVAEDMAMPDMPVADPAMHDDDRRNEEAMMAPDESPMMRAPVNKHDMPPCHMSGPDHDLAAAYVMPATRACFGLQRAIGADGWLDRGSPFRCALMANSRVATPAAATTDRGTASAATATATALYRAAAVTTAAATSATLDSTLATATPATTRTFALLHEVNTGVRHCDAGSGRGRQRTRRRRYRARSDHHGDRGETRSCL
jgi:hypothetical protein